MEHAVEHAVTVMRNQYYERMSVPELAADAFFSPFHFSRIFRRDTGVTPCQYLTAVRLFEAKRLLLTTSLNVADIACRVGYPGVGTFTTRFRKLVGMPPSHYRRLPLDGMLSIDHDACELPDLDFVRADQMRQAWAGGYGGSIAGTVHFGPVRTASTLLVGVFDDLIPQGPPVTWSLLPATDGAQWRFDDLPAGHWVVIAVAEAHSRTDVDQAEPTIFVGVGTPVDVTAGTTAKVELELHRPRRINPPIMVPLGGQLPARQSIAA